MQPDYGRLVFPRSAFVGFEIAQPNVQIAPLWEGALETPFHPMVADELSAISDTGGGRAPDPEDISDPNKVNLAGTLIFECDQPLGQTASPPLGRIYEGIYLAPAGVAELLEEISREDRRERHHGEIEIAVTDIREFFPRLGFVYGDVNVRMPTGEYDERSVRQKDPRRNEPYSLEDVLKWIVAHLPGSPKLIGLPARIRGHKIPAPTIRARGERAAFWLDVLMDRFKLSFGLTGANEVALSDQVGSPHDPEDPRFPSVSPGFLIAPAMPVVEALERTQWNIVPDIVYAVGEPLYQNVRRRAIAAIRDLDGRIRPLLDVLQDWRIPLGWALRHSTQPPDKAFNDELMHTFEPDVYLRGQKIRRLREDAFRLFQLESGIGRADDGRGASDPMLPMRYRAVRGDATRLERETAAQEIGRGQPGASHAEVSLGGDHPVVLEPPRISGWYVTQEDNADRATLERLIDREQEILEHFYLVMQEDIAVAREAGLEVLAARFEESKQTAVKRESYGRKLFDYDLGMPFGRGRGTLRLPEGTLFGRDYVDVIDVEKLQRVSELALADRAAFESKVIAALEAEAREFSTRFGRWEEFTRRLRDPQLWDRPTLTLAMARYGPLPSDLFVVEDADRGVIRTRIPMVETDRVADGLVENHVALRPSSLEVVYGIEHNLGSWRDRVVIPVVRDGDRSVHAGPPLTSGGIAGETVPLTGVTLYLDRESRPLNLREVLDAAEEAARDILLAPRYERAYSYVYAGWWPVDALGAVSSVTHGLEQVQGKAPQPITRIHVNARFGGGFGGQSPARKTKLSRGELAIQVLRMQR